MTHLTSPSYWDRQWEGLPLPAVVDMRSVSNRRLDALFHRYLEPSTETTFVELGCAPGQWLIYFHERFDYQVYGYDSSEIGIDLCRRNLETRGTPAVVEQRDIFSLSEKERFDIVFSAGLIEHFTDPAAILALHAGLLKKGGLLLLLIPNLRYLYYFLQALINPAVLAHHNLALMRPATFRGLVEAEPSCTSLFCHYIGIFNLGLLNTKRPSHLLTWADRLINSIFRILPPIETRFTSPYLLGVARKNKE